MKHTLPRSSILAASLRVIGNWTPTRIPEHLPPATAQTPAVPAEADHKEDDDMTSQADRITDLIASRPGIRNVEIAEELDLDADLIRPMIQPRIQNSRVIVDKIPGPNGVLINAYRINPKWTPADAKFKPKAAASEGDEDAPKRRGRKPGTTKPATKPRKKAVPQASPGPVAGDGADLQVVQEQAKSAGGAGAAEQFGCAVYHDGRVDIRTLGGSVSLTRDQAAMVAQHMARFDWSEQQ